MNLEIEWSPEAKRGFHNLIEYLESEWGARVAQKFIEHTNEVLGMIITYPGMYPRLEGKPNIRKCVLHRQTTMF